MKFIFYLSEGTSRYQMDYYRDLYEDPNCCFIAPWGSSNYFSKVLRRGISLIDTYSGSLFLESLNENRYLYDENEEYCIVLELGYAVNCNLSYYEQLRKNHNLKLVLLIIDSIDASSGVIKGAIKKGILQHNWDGIFSYDRGDCEKYGWVLFENLYSARPPVLAAKKRTDAYFVGGIKGNRENLILSTFNILLNNGVNCSFDLWDYKNEHRGIKTNGLHYRKFFVPYKKVCSKVKASNCIIEILQQEQHVQTLRWFEAIYYNRKLLTNNERVKELPYYNPEYIKYFARPEDIDVDWVKEKAEVDYHYKDDLSMKKLLPIITAAIEQ